VTRPLVPALAAVASLLLAAPAAARGCPGADAQPSAENAEASARAVRCLVNEARSGAGRRPLRGHAILRRTARAHAAHMVEAGFFSHVSPGGDGPAARAARRGAGRAGMRWIGENLAWATPARATPRGVVGRWLASPPHRATMLDRRFRSMGVGVVRGTPRREHPDGYTFALVLGDR
jgi:uncharacterized protein YkwD